MTDSPSDQAVEPGRIARYAMPANQTGWVRWIPALDTLPMAGRASGKTNPAGRVE